MAQRMIDAGYAASSVGAPRRSRSSLFRHRARSRARASPNSARQADHVGICVVNDADVRQICDALIPAMRPAAASPFIRPCCPRPASPWPKASRRARPRADRRAGQRRRARGRGGHADRHVRRRRRTPFDAGAAGVRDLRQADRALGGVGAGQRAKIDQQCADGRQHGRWPMHALAAGADARASTARRLIELIKASSGRSFGFEVYARLPSPAAFAHGAAARQGCALLGGAWAQTRPSPRRACAPYRRLSRCRRTSLARFLDRSQRPRSFKDRR